MKCIVRKNICKQKKDREIYRIINIFLDDMIFLFSILLILPLTYFCIQSFSLVPKLRFSWPSINFPYAPIASFLNCSCYPHKISLIVEYIHIVYS